MKHTRSKNNPHISGFKKKEVVELAKLIDSYEIIGIINVENLPCRQLQKMKTKLRKDMHIRMAKKNLIKHAILASKKKDIQKLAENLHGMPALLLTNTNPFKIYKTLKENKSAAPIKAGQAAPKDIIIPKGPTPFAPGPIIGEFGMLKIKAGIEAGKVVIKEDAHVAKKGDIISPQLSSLLLRLGIEPMEIGLNLTAVYENGEILQAEVLDIDQDAFMLKLTTAATEAVNLAIDIAFPASGVVALLIQKAFRDAKTIAREQNILADLMVEEIIAKADAQANAIATIVNQ
ncbi:MAG: 50S ribosomal protein L10 [Candidatus Woesearchaeota archaeon]